MNILYNRCIYMGLAQGSCAQKEFQIYVTCTVDLCYLRYSQGTMTFVRIT